MKEIVMFGAVPNENGLTELQRCFHKNAKGSENYQNINVSFCPDCGTIIVKRWYFEGEVEWIYYVSPWQVAENLLSELF